MNIEQHLVSKIIVDRDLNTATERGINQGFFLDPESRRVWQTIIEHNSEYGEVPSLGAIRQDFPEYKFVKPSDTLTFLVDQMRKQHSLSVLEEGLAEAVEGYDDADPQAALAALHGLISRIAEEIPNSRDVNLSETGEDRMAHYVALKELDGQLLGVPTGFDILDRATQGFQPGQLNFFVGPPKAGKTTLLILAAIAVLEHGKRPLVFTFEMSNQEISARIDAFRAQVSHERLRTGALKSEEWKRLDKALRAMEMLPDFWLSADSAGATTLSGIQAKIDTYKPDVVFIDGLYMLTDEQTGEQNTAQSLTNITRGLKRLAQNKELPINATTQVLEWKMDKKKGITSNSIGYSSSFAQDADSIIGVERTDDDAIQKLKIVLARNAPPSEVFVQWDWNLGVFEELEENPFEASEGDDGYAASSGF